MAAAGTLWLTGAAFRCNINIIRVTRISIPLDKYPDIRTFLTGLLLAMHSHPNNLLTCLKMLG